MLSDAIIIMSSLNLIAGEMDADKNYGNLTDCRYVQAIAQDCSQLVQY